jgi:hypothetical protein
VRKAVSTAWERKIEVYDLPLLWNEFDAEEFREDDVEKELRDCHSREYHILSTALIFSSL